MDIENTHNYTIPKPILEKYQLQIINKPSLDFLKEKNKEFSDKSFYVLDYAKVLKNVKKFKTECETVKPFYEVKANHDATLLEILSHWGFNFACFSLPEVKMVRAVSSNPVLITSPVISESEIQELVKYNVDFFLVDNLDHLQMLNKYDQNARLLIYIVSGSEERFGADLVKTSLILKKSKETNMHVEGVYFGVEQEEEIDKANSFIQDIKTLFEFYKFDLQLLLTNQEALDFSKNFLQDNAQLGVLLNSLICESYITSSEIINTVKVNEEKKEIRYYLTNGDLYLGRVYNDLEEKKPSLDQNEKYSAYTCTIYGPTCDSSDSIVNDVEFTKMNINDHIIFENIGYSSTVFSGSNFNGFNETYIQVKIFNLLNE